MFLKPFAGPRLLVERSRHHTQELQIYLDRVKSTLVIHFVRESESEPYVLQFSEHTDPKQFLVFREAINNLAVCLDVALCDAARLADKSIEKVKFPFAKTEKGLKGIIKDIGLGPHFEKWVADVHPLYGHNVWLSQLHDLDVLMKHRIVIPLLSSAPGAIDHLVPRHISDMLLGSLGLDLSRMTVPWKHGGKLWSATDIDPVVMAGFSGKLEMVLPKEVPFDGQSVIPLLSRLSEGMLAYISSVERLADRMKP